MQHCMVNEEPRRRAQHGSKLWLCTAVASKKVSLPATFWNKDSPLSCGNILTDEHGPILDQSALLPFVSRHVVNYVSWGGIVQELL